MGKLIIGIDPGSYQFKNDVIHYCQETGQPSTPMHHKAIFQECLSQIFQKMDQDFQVFMANLMELPVWTTIHYVDAPVDYDQATPFKHAVRAFAITLWHTMHNKGCLNNQNIYILESCSDTLAIVGQYVDADQA